MARARARSPTRRPASRNSPLKRRETEAGPRRPRCGTTPGETSARRRNPSRQSEARTTLQPRQPTARSPTLPQPSGPAEATPATRLDERHAPPWRFIGLDQRSGLLALALAVLVCGSYIPALQSGFVWDDSVFVEEPAVQDLSGLWQIWFSPAELSNEGHYWPVVYSSFWLEHKIWGHDPVGYHVVNVLLHLINCLLVWRLMARLAVPGAWLVAAVFGLHPLRVESVAWIIERKDLLSGLFFLAAALVWVWAQGQPGKRSYLLAMALFAAAILSKSIAVTLPASLLLWHWWQPGGVKRRHLVRLAPFFVLAGLLTLADLSFYQGREPLSLGYSLIERVQIACGALWWYAGKFLWPTDLAVIYPHWQVGALNLLAWLPVGATACAAEALCWARRRMGSGPLVGAMFFAVTLSPVLGFIDYGYMQFSFVADRFQYLAGLGLIAVLIGGGARVAAGLQGWASGGARAVAALVLCVLATMTYRQAGIYRDGITFFSHVISHNPAARDAHVNLSAALIGAGRPEEALSAALTAIEQDTAGLSKAHLNAGTALLLLDRFRESQEHLSKAMAMEPENARAIKSYAELFARQAEWAEAVRAYRDALAINPKDWQASAKLAEALFEMGRHNESIEAAQRALSLSDDPRQGAGLHILMGRSWQRLGRLERADEEISRAMDASDGSREALLAMSGLRHEQGRLGESAEYLNRAKEIDSRSEASLRYVADALRKQQRLDEALEVFAEVLEATPRSALGHAGKGHTLFDLGRDQDAIDAMAEAISLDPGLSVAGTLHRLMAQASERLGRSEDVERHLLAAIEIDPGDSDAVDRIALLTYGQQRYAEAERWYETLVDLRPDDAQGFANLAATRYYVGKQDEAIRAFERALVLDPDLEAARVGLAQVRARAGSSAM